MLYLLIIFFWISSFLFIIYNMSNKDNTSHSQQESLNRFNNEFVDNLSTLKDKRKKLVKKIKRDETINTHLKAKIQTLQKEQTKVEASLVKKNKSLEKMNITIQNTSSAYNKIIETSHVLLAVLKKDSNIKD
jgi:sjoegren syndrome nuclear autoantigen 1